MLSKWTKPTAQEVSKSLIVLFFGCVLALLLAEGILRIYNPFEFRVKSNKIILPANKTYIVHNPENPNVALRHTKNKLGFRGPDLPTKNLTPLFSIVSVGGSTTECFYQSDDQAWPYLLSKKLDPFFINLWLNNAGLDGHSTFGHLILLNDYLIKLDPKVVLFLVGINDVGLVVDSSQAANEYRTGIHFDSFENFFKSICAYSETASLILNLSRYWRAKVTGRTHEPLALTLLLHQSADPLSVKTTLKLHTLNYIPGYKARLLALIKICREHAIVPIFVTQPYLLGDGIDPLTGVNLKTIQTTEGPGDLLWKTLELYNNTLRQLCLDQHVYFIDLAHKLPKNSLYFYDAMHFTSKGSAQVARIIESDLTPYLKRKFPAYIK